MEIVLLSDTRKVKSPRMKINVSCIFSEFDVNLSLVK